jgi:signal peptidase I
LKRSHLVREIVETVVLTLLIFLAIRFVIQSYHVEGMSMEPGLTSNEFVMVNKVAYLFQSPQRGDVIVFHYPRNTSVDYIKRIIGIPGDTIKIDSTRVWVNGVLLKESYISEPINPRAKTWQVPANSYFVMGDNRPVSDDSRYWDYVPKDFIVGKAAMIYWPTANWQFINTFPSVYAQVKPGH